MRLPWKRRPACQDKPTQHPAKQKEADAALSAAKSDLAETTDKVQDVKRRSKWLRIEREKNHFGPAVEKLLRDGR